MKIDQLMEMAYPQKVARDIIIGMARPINQHLVKLVGFDFPPHLHNHFRGKLRNWLNEIQRIRLKPNGLVQILLRSIIRLSVRRHRGSKYARLDGVYL
jgi:hypothetical protein